MTFLDPRDGSTFRNVYLAYDACHAEDLADFDCDAFDWRGPGGSKAKRLEVVPL